MEEVTIIGVDLAKNVFQVGSQSEAITWVAPILLATIPTNPDPEPRSRTRLFLTTSARYRMNCVSAKPPGQRYAQYGGVSCLILSSRRPRRARLLAGCAL